MKKERITALLIGLILISVCYAQKDDEAQERIQRSIKGFEKEIRGSVLEVEWCGTDEIYNDETDRVEVDQDIEDSFDTRVFFLTDEGQVYKSNNYGKNWLHLNQMFQKSSKDDFFATEISISPVDGKTVYVWGNKDISYVSEECGKSWKKITHPAALRDFRFHRKNKNFILAYQDIRCKKFDTDCDSSLKKLYVSQDAGLTFTLITEKAIEASWNRMNNFYNVESPGIILAVQKENRSDVVYTEDFGKEYHMIQEGGDNFFQAEYFLFITVKPKTNKQTYELKIATMFDDFNYYVEPKSVQLPFESKDHVSFSILKSDGSQVFLSIHHETQDFKQSNVYVSDWRGYELNLALLYNVRNSHGDCDFEKIKSNEGVFIANTYDSEKVEKLKSTPKKMDVNTLKNKKNSIAKINLNEELQYFKKSVISFDNGSNWHSIKAPTKKANGEIYKCSGECSLHLTGRTYERNIQMYSSSNAPGIIVATGNVGKHLSITFAQLNTYLSKDGGHTWIEILRGPHIFEIGDHGGIILAATAVNRTNIIKYSWDEGKTWNQYKMNVKPFEIEAIVTEPSNMEQRFIVYGKQINTSDDQSTQLVTIDLQDLKIRGCVGAEHPDRPNSDYETWIPTNFKGDQCLFGRKIKYIRRKPDAQCYNSITTEQKTVVEECPCSEEDWECDFGFYRQDNQGDCIPVNEHYSLENLSKPPPDCSWSYFITKGYRKIPGMYCEGGVDLGPEMKECPPKVVEARTEETTEKYLNYKAEQQKYIDQILEEEQLKVKEKKAFDPISEETNSSFSFGGFFKTVLCVVMILGTLYCGFLFREQIRNVISSIGSIGQSRVEREYEQLKSTYKQKFPSQNKSSTVRIQETEERNYDLEDQEPQYEEDKPVLQRDQEYYEEQGYY